MREAVLTGTRRNPAIVLRFAGRDYLPRAAKLPRTKRRDLPALDGPPKMLDWVRRLPGRRWDPDQQCWIATALGPDPDKVLADAEFTLDLGKGPAVGITSLAVLVDPIVELGTEVPARFAGTLPDLTDAQTVIWPRLSGYELVLPAVPAAAKWVAEPGCWVAETADMHAVTGLAVPDHIRDLAHRLHAERIATDVDPTVQAKAAQLAAAKHIDDVREHADHLVQTAGDVPDWFGFDLFGYQHAGSLAVATGHSVLVDEPGLGKTAQALAAAAVRDVERLVVVCPPVVNTNWQRETERSHLVEHMGKGRAPASLAPPRITPGPAPDQDSLPPVDRDAHAVDAKIVRFVSGRKEPALPERGVAIVADSLLAARPTLLQKLVEWAPDGLFYDEAHRAQTFESERASAVRVLAEAVGDGLRVPITGTPISKGPQDLPGILAVSGHLDTVFGGHSAFLERYCKRNHFNAWVAKPDTLDELRHILEAQVWTRRTKAQVLPDLPKKLRTATYLDVDLALFKAAHTGVVEVIDEWLNDFVTKYRRLPTLPDPGEEKELGRGSSEVEAWARTQVGLVTRLRAAAGLAKVDAATALIREHVEATTETSSRGPVYTRPLIVWVHHRDVGMAMMRAVPTAVARTAVIRGGTSADERGRIVDDFQDGKIPVLVASIVAAGVGITLTRSHDMKFVETDWTVSNVTQAEDRSCRIGQTHPVNVSTLIAPGTLDERIQGVLQEKSVVLDKILTGGDNNPAVLLQGLDGDTATTRPAGIVTEMAVGLVRQRESSAAKGRRRAA